MPNYYEFKVCGYYLYYTEKGVLEHGLFNYEKELYENSIRF